MFFLIYFFYCVLQPFHVLGRRESLHRFVVEDGAKPAIFGSYSYDPVKQVFVPPPPENETSFAPDMTTGSTLPDQIVNGSFVYSTAVGDATSHTEHDTTHHGDHHSSTHHDEHTTTHHGDHTTDHHHTEHTTDHHNGEHTTDHTTPVYRKNVTPQPKNAAWWARQKMPKNSNIHKLNNIL